MIHFFNLILMEFFLLLLLQRTNTERLVYQFHFTDWPDHGVPYYIMPVLTFIKKSSRANPELGGPIVVHCSAGVGRTGTYIVIDSMMKQIKHKQTINIHTFLKHIRHQRNYLVQTEEQFVFIYDVLVESLKSGETDLNEHNFKAYIASLSRLVNDDVVKLVDRQYQLISEFKPKDYQISFAQMPYNLSKNRSQRIIPVNNSRVILSKKPGIEGSEYINASYIHVINYNSYIFRFRQKLFCYHHHIGFLLGIFTSGRVHNHAVSTRHDQMQLLANGLGQQLESNRCTKRRRHGELRSLLDAAGRDNEM